MLYKKTFTMKKYFNQNVFQKSLKNVKKKEKKCLKKSLKK